MKHGQWQERCKRSNRHYFGIYIQRLNCQLLVIPFLVDYNNGTGIVEQPMEVEIMLNEKDVNDLQKTVAEMRIEISELKREVSSLCTTVKNVTNRNIEILAEGMLRANYIQWEKIKDTTSLVELKIKLNELEHKLESLS